MPDQADEVLLMTDLGPVPISRAGTPCLSVPKLPLPFPVCQTTFSMDAIMAK